MDEMRSAKCVACDGIFLKADLSDDGRCAKCIAEKKEPKRKPLSN